MVAVIKETDIYQNEIVEYTFFQNYVCIKALPILEVVSIYQQDYLLTRKPLTIVYNSRTKINTRYFNEKRKRKPINNAL